MPSTASKPPIAAWELLIATPTLAIVTLLLWQFVDLWRVEHLLHRAAQAAVMEATLPKATTDSVNAVVHRSLAGTSLLSAVDAPALAINRRPEMLNPLGTLRCGDTVEVTLGVWSTDVVPDILRPIGLSLAGRKLHVTASAQKH